ncbi:MAG TPA: hypothetical protein VNL38_02295, partial [Candidatus Nitrosotenuis sp.]|nr:hypothetical protein [Candidatus Nitrosotenuis sp.]
MAVLALGVAALVSGVYVATMSREALSDTHDRARTVAQQIFLQAQHALTDAADRGLAPASESRDDVREYVRQTLAENTGLASQIDAAIAYSRTIYEVSVVDRDATVLISSDSSLPGRTAPGRPLFEQLQQAGVFERLQNLYGPPRVYEVRLPFNIGSEAFGEIRVGISTVFLRAEMNRRMMPMVLLALAAVLISALLSAAVSTITLAPLARISAQLDRIVAGETDVEPVGSSDELGQVSRKISRIGQQMRDFRKDYATREEEQLDRITRAKVAERLAA